MRRDVFFTFLFLSWLYVAAAAGQEPRRCAEPRRYPHATLERSFAARRSFSAGQTVRYSCADGLVPSTGLRVTRCSDGQWTRLTLKCQKKSCGNAGDLPNGHFEYERNAYIGEKVNALCNKGFTLKGPAYMVCKKSGWSGERPTCEASAAGEAACPPLAVENSVSSGGGLSGFRVGNAVTFACAQGFLLHGAQQVTCGPGGRWQAEPPQCLPARGPAPSPGGGGGCGVPDIVTNSNADLADKYITVASFAPGDRVRYVCDEGYVAAGGSRYRRCLHGEWTPLLMRCQRKVCGSAGEVANGQFRYTGVQFGDTATAVCDEGHRLVGQASRNCLSKGWDGRVPVCEAVVCDDNPEATNARVDGLRESYTYRTVVRYHCEAGTLQGPTEIWCTKDGTWNAPPPTCREVTCPSPNVPGAFWAGAQGRLHQYRDTISIECDPGYTRVGPGTVTCGGDGRWTPGLPRCAPAQRRIRWRS